MVNPFVNNLQTNENAQKFKLKRYTTRKYYNFTHTYKYAPLEILTTTTTASSTAIFIALAPPATS